MQKSLARSSSAGQSEREPTNDADSSDEEALDVKAISKALAELKREVAALRQEVKDLKADKDLSESTRAALVNC